MQVDDVLRLGGHYWSAFSLSNYRLVALTHDVRYYFPRITGGRVESDDSDVRLVTPDQ